MYLYKLLDFFRHPSSGGNFVVKAYLRCLRTFSTRYSSSSLCLKIPSYLKGVERSLFIKISKDNQGFLLLEVALALLIVGVVLGVGVPKMIAYVNWQRHQETKERQERIFYSVAAFAVQNKYIPLPADPKATEAQFGYARQKLDSSQDRYGVVPFKTLGLPPEYAKDGFQRYFTYMGGGPSSQTLHTKIPDKFLIKMDGTLIDLLIISHGEKGYGAYVGSPGKLQEFRTASEEGRIHAQDSLVFTEKQFSNQQIAWVTKQNLFALYAKTSLQALEKSSENRNPLAVDPDGPSSKTLPKASRGKKEAHEQYI